MHFKSSRHLSAFLIGALAVVLPLASQAGGALTLSKKAHYEKDAHVPAAVRSECALEEKVPNFVREAAARNFDKISLADGVSARTPGKALGLTITGVLAPGGGPWSGPKSVTVHGTYWDNGKQIGSFTARRNTTHGAGTCNMLERDSKEIASDIAKWLESPGKDSRLGDAK